MNMAHDHFSLRPMIALDLPECHHLTTRLQWAHRIEDWVQAFRVSKGVVLQTEGRIVGTALACLKGEQSSIGLITIDPEYQRRGFGRRLTNEVLNIATENVSLVATDAGRGLYESLGFTETGVVQQWMGHSSQRAVATERKPEAEIRRAQARDIADIYRLNQSATVAFSQPLLDELLITAEAVLVAVHADVVSGFCIVRPFGQGAVIGPIISASVQVAAALVSASMRCVKDTTLRIDTNGIEEFERSLQALGFRCVSRVVRMGLGQTSEIQSTCRQFSLASQALL